MNKRSLRAVLTLALTLAIGVGAMFVYPAIYSAAVGSAASDVPSEWAAEQVDAAIAAGLVPAPMQSKYTQATTRAEFAALAVIIYEKVTAQEVTGRTSFSDTADVNVEKAAAIGVVTGTGNNMFDPDAKLTREQAAVMLNRLADAVGSPLTGHGQGEDFADSAIISDWAVGAVRQVRASGIMGGVGANAFAPQEPYTREQSIVTAMRFWDMMNGVASGAAMPEPVRAPGEAPTPTATTGPRATTGPTATTESTADDGVEWREYLARYEEWVDAYVEMMEKYKSNPSDITMLAEYGAMMSEMVEWTDKLSLIEAGLANDLDELPEYMQTIARILEKLNNAM